MKKDIVERIDEILPFALATAAGVGAGIKKSGPMKKNRMEVLFKKVANKAIEAGGLMQAVDLVAKQEKLSARWKKKLAKYVKKYDK